MKTNKNLHSLLVQHDTIVLLLEPFDSLVLGGAVGFANGRFGVTTTSDTETRATHHHKEVHTCKMKNNEFRFNYLHKMVTLNVP